MKNIFLNAAALVLLFTLNVTAQSKTDKKREAELAKIRNEVYNSGDKDFEISKAPDKWKNESAVILCQKLTQIYNKTGADYGIGSNKGVEVTEVFRKRIILQDKSAVQSFSEYYFQSTDNIGIRVIKPDGKKFDVDLSQAVEVENTAEVPNMYLSYYRFTTKYKKIAIPDLQPGDVVDYFYKITDSKYIPGVSFIPFSDVIISLANTYHTVKQKIEFKVEKRFYINIKSTNGAPTLKPENMDETFFVYTLTDVDREKLFDERWTYTYRSTPTIKYQVFYVQNKSTDSNYIVGEPGVPKTSITTDEAVEQARNMYKEGSSGTREAVAFVNDCLKEKLGKDADPITTVKEAFYCLRAWYSTPSVYGAAVNYLDQTYDGVMQGVTNKRLYGPNNNDLSNKYLVDIFYDVLTKRKIPFKVAFAVPRRIGTIDDAILADEFLPIVYVEGSKPLFIGPLTNYSHPDEADYRIEGVDAYLINSKVSKKDKSFDVVKIPMTAAKDNITIEKSDVTFKDDMELVSIKRKTTIKGHNKEPYYNSTIILADYTDAEMTAYSMLKPRYNYKGSKTKTAEINKAADDTKKAVMKDREDRLKDELKEEGWDVASFDGFKLIQTGRDPKKHDIVYDDAFTAKGLIKKVGPNYIFDAGMLIGGQLEIDENEKTRHYDIYMNNPRSFEYQISVTIPAGFKAEGVDKLNMKVDNSTGTFTATAKVEGDKLIINSLKVYKNNYEPKDKWAEMIQFLDEAYKFKQTKVVFKKA